MTMRHHPFLTRILELPADAQNRVMDLFLKILLWRGHTLGPEKALAREIAEIFQANGWEIEEYT